MRGLKWIKDELFAVESAAVAPYTGAWIEIRYHNTTKKRGIVAPYTGAWIEIVYC